MPDEYTNFPGGSKGSVTKAGNYLRNYLLNQNLSTSNTSTQFSDLTQWVECNVVIDEWRAAHRKVLNTFQASLRNRTRNTKIIVAQRHKRLRTILDKLQRFPKMQLARMDDVAGCRLIFPSLEDMYEFRAKFHQARFSHRRKNEDNKYDYVKKPKGSGYRGIHDVYEYDVRSESGAALKGLLIELQYRTLYQHAWATCVEVVGFITESQPKFEKGDQRYTLVLQLASEMIARVFENTTSCFPELSNKELAQQFLDLDKELHFMNMLRNINAVDQKISGRKNIILIFSETEDLKTQSYDSATDALRALFELEKANPGKDIVLVKADSNEEVRIAFRNYFSDAREFIRYVDEACQTLFSDDIKIMGPFPIPNSFDL